MKRGIAPTLPQAKDVNILVVIPSAGMANRMRSHGTQSLQKIGNTPLINRQISYINNVCPNTQIAVVCGFESEKLFNHLPTNIAKLENSTFYSTNVCKSISIALRAFESYDHMLLVMGDLFFNEEAIKKIDFGNSCVIISETMNKEEVGCIIQEDKKRLLNMSYDTNPKWGQIAFLKNKELELFKKFVFKENNKSKMAFEAINYVIDKGGKIKTIKDDSIFTFDLDSPKDIRKIREQYENSIPTNK